MEVQTSIFVFSLALGVWLGALGPHASAMEHTGGGGSAGGRPVAACVPAPVGAGDEAAKLARRLELLKRLIPDHRNAALQYGQLVLSKEGASPEEKVEALRLLFEASQSARFHEKGPEARQELLKNARAFIGSKASEFSTTGLEALLSRDTSYQKRLLGFWKIYFASLTGLPFAKALVERSESQDALLMNEVQSGFRRNASLLSAMEILSQTPTRPEERHAARVLLDQVEHEWLMLLGKFLVSEYVKKIGEGRTLDRLGFEGLRILENYLISPTAQSQIRELLQRSAASFYKSSELNAEEKQQVLGWLIEQIIDSTRMEFDPLSNILKENEFDEALNSRVARMKSYFKQACEFKEKAACIRLAQFELKLGNNQEAVKAYKVIIMNPESPEPLILRDYCNKMKLGMPFFDLAELVGFEAIYTSEEVSYCKGVTENVSAKAASVRAVESDLKQKADRGDLDAAVEYARTLLDTRVTREEATEALRYLLLADQPQRYHPKGREKGKLLQEKVSSLIAAKASGFLTDGQAFLSGSTVEEKRLGYWLVHFAAKGGSPAAKVIVDTLRAEADRLYQDRNGPLRADPALNQVFTLLTEPTTPEKRKRARELISTSELKWQVSVGHFLGVYTYARKARGEPFHRLAYETMLFLQKYIVSDLRIPFKGLLKDVSDSFYESTELELNEKKQILTWLVDAAIETPGLGEASSTFREIHQFEARKSSGLRSAEDKELHRSFTEQMERLTTYYQSACDAGYDGACYELIEHELALEQFEPAEKRAREIIKRFAPVVILKMYCEQIGLRSPQFEWKYISAMVARHAPPDVVTLCDRMVESAASATKIEELHRELGPLQLLPNVGQMKLPKVEELIRSCVKAEENFPKIKVPSEVDKVRPQFEELLRLKEALVARRNVEQEKERAKADAKAVRDAEAKAARDATRLSPAALAEREAQEEAERKKRAEETAKLLAETQAKLEAERSEAAARLRASSADDAGTEPKKKEKTRGTGAGPDETHRDPSRTRTASSISDRAASTADLVPVNIRISSSLLKDLNLLLRAPIHADERITLKKLRKTFRQILDGPPWPSGLEAQYIKDASVLLGTKRTVVKVYKGRVENRISGARRVYFFIVDGVVHIVCVVEHPKDGEVIEKVDPFLREEQLNEIPSEFWTLNLDSTTE